MTEPRNRSIGRETGTDTIIGTDSPSARFNAGISYSQHLIKVLMYLDHARLRHNYGQMLDTLMSLFSHVSPYMTEEMLAEGKKLREEARINITNYYAFVRSKVNGRSRIVFDVNSEPVSIPIPPNPETALDDFDIFVKKALFKAKLLNPGSDSAIGGLDEA